VARPQSGAAQVHKHSHHACSLDLGLGRSPARYWWAVSGFGLACVAKTIRGGHASLNLDLAGRPSDR
jgi:hypothetical protein